MVSLSEVKASNARISKATLPSPSSKTQHYTAVFTGATAGIGKATLTRLVATKLALRVYVIGRNGSKHELFLDELRRENELAEIIWLEAEIELLGEVRRVCDVIRQREREGEGKREGKVDGLFMSAGFIAVGERRETSEGILAPLSLCYYGRTLMMTLLLPLLNNAASSSSHSPRIVSILAAGTESASGIHLDDLDLKKPENYNLMTTSRSTTTYTTLTMSRLAWENPGVVFIHHYPGGVNTGAFKRAFGGKWFWWPLALVLALFGTAPEDAGEKAVYLLTSAKYGGKGVPLLAGKEQSALTMAKTSQPGSLFLINDKIQELQQEKVMEELNKMEAGDIIWRKTKETLRPYSS